ncbi:MAG: hypothetical protein KF897_10535 [Opitutaceae bacterium]|nr:hypothetical protein [Opitutaceae bacterium]
MDEENLQLEAELKRLRPRALAPAVEARVAARLATRRRVAIGWWVALPLAAALALVVVPWRPAPEPERVPLGAAIAPDPLPATKPDEYKPVAAENLLYAARDEGVVTLADGVQARRLRRSYVDTITWRNPRTNASLTWSVPRDEVRVVPVNFQ